MFPPTPTPLAAVVSVPVSINSSAWRIWAFTDEAIMLWNRANDYQFGTVIQIAILVIMIIFFVVYLTRLAQSLTNEGEL